MFIYSISDVIIASVIFSLTPSKVIVHVVGPCGFVGQKFHYSLSKFLMFVCFCHPQNPLKKLQDHFIKLNIPVSIHFMCVDPLNTKTKMLRQFIHLCDSPLFDPIASLSFGKRCDSTTEWAVQWFPSTSELWVSDCYYNVTAGYLPTWTGTVLTYYTVGRGDVFSSHPLCRSGLTWSNSHLCSNMVVMSTYST